MNTTRKNKQTRCQEEFTNFKLNYVNQYKTTGIFNVIAPHPFLNVLLTYNKLRHICKMILAFFINTLNSVFHYQQIGSGFGYGIIVCDYNGDGVDDILVSAPFFSTAGSIDTGRVFVFLGTGNVSLYNNMHTWNTKYTTLSEQLQN